MGLMAHWAQRFSVWARSNHSEEVCLQRFVCRLGLSTAHRILDVGCGYGRRTKGLVALGLNTLGVDLQEEIVRVNKAAGANCMTVEAFDKTSDLYDLLLMLHVIEHMDPDRLLQFMDTYLDRLKPGGHLIIAAPLLSPSFYDDFDHIRPYQPIGFNMVFNGRGEQVKYYSRHILELQDIWFRRGSLELKYKAGLYVRGHSRVPAAINIGLAILFRASGRLIGRTTGWMALYRKVEQTNDLR